MIRNLEIKYRDIVEIKPYINNSRIHSDEQIEKISKSIQEFGFNNPVLIDEDGTVIAGHGRVLAAKKIGLFEIPTITLIGLTDDQRKAYLIADNRLAELGEWDHNLLLEELEKLGDFSLDFDSLGLDDGFINSLSNYHQFEPNFDPSAEKEDVTDSQLEKKKKKMGEAYQEKSEQNLVLVICPHCAEEFNIDPEALRRNS